MGAPYETTGPLPLLLYIRGQGRPIDTQVDQLIFLPCTVPPSTIIHLGHIVIVLRRSPAPVASSSPSSCRSADETLPRPQLDQEYEGRRRAERVQIAEVPCVRYLIGWIAKTFDYINRVVLTLPLSVYEGKWTHSPLSLLCITMILRVRRNFFEITTFPNTYGALFIFPTGPNIIPYALL